MQATIHPRSTTLVRTPEEMYLREGPKVIHGKTVMIYRAHPSSPCEICEFPLGSNYKHPLVPGETDIRLVCENIHVRMTS